MDYTPSQRKLRKQLLKALTLKLFMLTKLPAAWFCGVRVREITPESCSVSLPYRWSTKNPFRSIYFASQSMAAEFSTGALAAICIAGQDRKVSMLVVGLSAEFLKKAGSKVTFTCANGKEFHATIKRTVETGEPQTIEAMTIGRDAQGNVVSSFRIKWSFMAK